MTSLSIFSNNTSYDEALFETVKSRVKGYEDEMNVMQNMNIDVDLSSMNRDITLEEVMNAAGKAKLGEAVGINQLPFETLKYGPVYPFMVNLFNYCFKCKIIPSAWQKEVINPIPKSGDKDIRLPLNYRGITLTCHMYKVYCTILNVQLSTFFYKKNRF